MNPLEELLWLEVNFQYSREIMRRINYELPDDPLERATFAKNWNRVALWAWEDTVK